MTLHERTTRLELLSAYVEDGNKRRPVSALGTVKPHPHEPGIHHLHGELCWTVGACGVPCMGVGDPDQRVPFAWSDFVEEVRSFQAQLRDLLQAEGPTELPEDWAARLTRGE
jgi:hypothetical protein